MLINGKNLMTNVVKLLERENKFLEQMYEISEKGETAKNLQNNDELIRLGSEGTELSNKVNAFMLEKIVIMSMVISNTPNFKLN